MAQELFIEGCRITDRFVLFWGSVFSQWHQSSFVVDNVEYANTEQYMMAGKAKLFGDFKILKQIMATNNSRKIKSLGRAVSGFDEQIWKANCRDIVRRGNYAKFSQDPVLKQILLSTGDREIVEASPYDTIWGIGLGQDDPDCLDKSKWRGTNWLGEAIMSVREELRNQDLNE
eukprot:TRINITY_DN2547_c0_g1_i2.p1 TRINITY_DN2547_c0_g1~~TRINITY_DN2547_c0_g1_i2.p1  ORF type:complete len:173 (+),score=40.01 TRINITY_DN2547_c0_g1_i2:57-575(+)